MASGCLIKKHTPGLLKVPNLQMKGRDFTIDQLIDVWSRFGQKLHILGWRLSLYFFTEDRVRCASLKHRA